jgi:putative endonuclease
LAKHHVLSAAGERLAVNWLAGKGFVLLHRNWRHSYYEVDIKAALKNTLHFIEVKTRRNTKFGEPEERVDQKKFIRLMKAAEEYQYKYPEWKYVQYDVLSIFIQPHNTAAYFFMEDIYL